MEINSKLFGEMAKELYRLSTAINDEWILHNALNDEIFLSKKVRKIMGGEMLTFEYHVAFDMIYSVPILCFNVYHVDGSQINTDECLKLVNFQGEDALKSLSQKDHPILQRPFFCLHPCKTSDFLGSLDTPSKNILVTWLSTVGAKVGLYLDNEYARLTQ